MDLTTFEALVIKYKEIQFNDEEWEKADSLLEQIADIHTENPEHYEPIMKKHKISY